MLFKRILTDYNYSLFFLLADDLKSEITFKYDVLHRIINFDETHLTKSSEGDKGGPRANTLTNPALPRTGTRVFKDPGGHVTGVFGSNPLEAMPPIVIFETKSKKEENLRVKPSWCKDLPVVEGQWGFDEKCVMDAHIAVRRKGSMDEDLFIQTVLFYRSLYPNLAPRFKFSSNGKVIAGQIFIKTDSGPGRNCKSERSIKFRRDMHRDGVHLGPGLPNSTSATQEMDDWFQHFKGSTDIAAQTIFEMKLFNYSKAIRDCQNGEESTIKGAALTNDDIPYIINGRQDDPIEQRPFFHCATPANIFKSWLNVGFIPFTRKALTNQKVRHMLGDGGASDEMAAKIKSVQDSYDKLKAEVRSHGINEFVFNARIPVYRKSDLLQRTEDEQVKSIVKRKNAFTAGGLWMALGFQLMGSRATTRAQVQQLEEEKKAATQTAAKKVEDLRVKVEKAEAAFKLYKAGKNMSKDNWYDIIKFLLPLFDSNAAPSKFNSMKKATTKLNEFESLYRSKWDVLMELKLQELQTKPLCSEVNDTAQLLTLRDGLHLDSDTDDDIGDTILDKDKDGEGDGDIGVI